MSSVDRSQRADVGQGEVTRYAPSAGFDPFQNSAARNSSLNRRSTRSGSRAASLKSTKPTLYGPGPADCGDSLTRCGRPDIADPASVFEPSGHVWAHHCCAAWSSGVAPRTQKVKAAELNAPAAQPNIILVGVDRAVAASLARKCKYCQNYGASVKCKVEHCPSWYHYPCAVASGAFQDRVRNPWFASCELTSQNTRSCNVILKFVL